MVFQQIPPSGLSAWRIGVLPFSLSFSAEPAPPDFARLLRQSLPDSVYLEGVVWDDARLTEDERVAAAAACVRRRGLDAAVLGRVETLFRRTSGGLAAKVELRVVAAESGEVLWYGAKRAEWPAWAPIEDCLRELAASFAADFTAPSQRGRR